MDGTGTLPPLLPSSWETSGSPEKNWSCSRCRRSWCPVATTILYFMKPSHPSFEQIDIWRLSAGESPSYLFTRYPAVRTRV